MVRISHIIIQGNLINPDDYNITKGNRWLDKFENLCMVHAGLKAPNPAFSIDWKSGKIGRWEHDFELSSKWVLKNVIITYIDKCGHTYLQVHPEEFKFHYNISKNGVIKNWREHKKGFISILKWSLDNVEVID